MRRGLVTGALAVAFAATPVAASTATVKAVDNEFRPATKTVAVGDTVTWTNAGSSAHEVTADAFKSGNLDPGKSYSWTATKAGTYSYVCRYHEALGMKGTLVVSASGLPKTGGDRVALGLLLLGATAVVGTSLRFGWRTR